MVFPPKFQDGYQNNYGISWGTMSVIFSDAIFRMSMFFEWIYKRKEFKLHVKMVFRFAP